MRKQTGTKYYLNERKIEAVNAQKPGFAHPMVTRGKASPCKVTRADGTTYTLNPAKSHRKARENAKLASYAAETRNHDLLKLCGNIGDSNH